MLGLVVGPGVVLGVGLVVLGVSVPVPPMPDDDPPADPPMDPPVELPLPLSDGIEPVLLPELLPEVPGRPLLLVPELLPLPSPELPPVMPAHALSSTAQAIGIIHLIIRSLPQR